MHSTFVQQFALIFRKTFLSKITHIYNYNDCIAHHQVGSLNSLFSAHSICNLQHIHKREWVADALTVCKGATVLFNIGIVWVVVPLITLAGQ